MGLEPSPALGHLGKGHLTSVALYFQKEKLRPTLFTQELAEPDHKSSGPGSLAGQPAPLLRGSAENP